MKSEIDNAVSAAQLRVRNEFAAAFRDIYADHRVPSTFGYTGIRIDSVQVASAEDISRIHHGNGFYVIFSSRPIQGNKCSLFYGELRAIYRGECATTKKRILSHLFHAHYKSQYNQRSDKYQASPKNIGKSFYEAFWPHCLKLEAGGAGGIDVDQEPHSNHTWHVIVHRMDGSSQQVREQAEAAFDEVFGHPAASRDA